MTASTAPDGSTRSRAASSRRLSVTSPSPVYRFTVSWNEKRSYPVKPLPPPCAVASRRRGQRNGMTRTAVFWHVMPVSRMLGKATLCTELAFRPARSSSMCCTYGAVEHSNVNSGASTQRQPSKPVRALPSLSASTAPPPYVTAARP